MKQKKRTYLLIFGLVYFSLSMAHNDMTDKEVWVTVFVHGIKSVKMYLTPDNWIRLWRDDVQDSFYSRSISIMRHDPFFYQHQPMQELGLQPIINQVAPGAASSAVATLFDRVDSINNPSKVENIFYTFGWDALLSHKSRYNAAKELYQSLLNLRQEMNDQGVKVRFRLIGYSHGGNVVSNIGSVYENENVDKSLVIDELIVFGMPLHKNTARYIMSPVFGQIYNIYSAADRVQPIDIFSSGRIISPRTFYNTKHCKLQHNLHQIELHIVRKAGDCNRPYAPDTNAFYYDGQCKSYLLRDASPGHLELWFFGWTPYSYRPTFPLYPLPTVVFLPFILNAVRPVQHHYRPTRPIIVILDPRNNKMVIKDKRNYGPCYVDNFIDHATMESLKETAWRYEPQEFSKETFGTRMQRAVEQTNDERKDERFEKRACRMNGS